MFRLGGRETAPRYGGSFKTQREALARRRWIEGELAALRVPDLRALAFDAAKVPTLEVAARQWRESRVDVSSGTATLHRVALGRVLPTLGARRVDELTAADVAELVAKLHADEYKRETIRKSVTALAQVLDYHGITLNPARDRIKVKLPA